MLKRLPVLPKSNIPWWQDGKTISTQLVEPYFLSKGVHQFFRLINGWMLFPLRQADALTCSESMLNLMAWDRDITRFEDEPLSLFRVRVKYAAVNAKDAGSVAGFIQIFERLGVGFIEIDERLPGRDWDIISIRVDDSQLTEDAALLDEIIRSYGRTCRRYEFEVIAPVLLEMSAAPMDWEHQCHVAILEE
ncbi:phage tail protein [Psychromonas ossibalaenae]|uniref:phage tail protein n=1 Tax=Psychromonas ossibalaenae TaxID=444922 RepID=UPI00037C6350|nr:phage tail protein [Psychromonas ossibalaenae]